MTLQKPTYLLKQVQEVIFSRLQKRGSLKQTSKTHLRFTSKDGEHKTVYTVKLHGKKTYHKVVITNDNPMGFCAKCTNLGTRA